MPPKRKYLPQSISPMPAHRARKLEVMVLARPGSRRLTPAVSTCCAGLTLELRSSALRLRLESAWPPRNVQGNQAGKTRDAPPSSVKGAVQIPGLQLKKQATFPARAQLRHFRCSTHSLRHSLTPRMTAMPRHDQMAIPGPPRTWLGALAQQAEGEVVWPASSWPKMQTPPGPAGDPGSFPAKCSSS